MVQEPILGAHLTVQRVPLKILPRLQQFASCWLNKNIATAAGSRLGLRKYIIIQNANLFLIIFLFLVIFCLTTVLN